MIIEPIILIPARLASSRLFAKPLLDLLGQPMIVRVCLQGVKAGVGPVAVAAGDATIARTVERAGFEAVLTDPNHPSGSDRVYEAVTLIDPERRFNVVVNLQGDLPTIEPETIRATIEGLADPRVDIATAVSTFDSEEEFQNVNRVKALMDPQDPTIILDFEREPREGGLYHIGIYAYRREALERFVSLPESPRERLKKVEQLRAIDHGLIFGAAMVADKPLGIDTPADVIKIREILSYS